MDDPRTGFRKPTAPSRSSHARPRYPDTAIDVELLYFDGCPSWRTPWTKLKQVLDDLGIQANVHLEDVTNLDETDRWGFAGSPTLRINGRDLEDYDGPPRMACRRYPHNAGKGWPSDRLLQTRLQEARSPTQPHRVARGDSN